jgi:hypothetical protein
MSTLAGKSESRQTEAESHRRQAADPTQAMSTDAQGVLLSLHQNMGNGAVGRLLDAFAGKAPEGPGEPLGEATRLDMESRFGQDFGDVRIHRDGGAASTARAAHAEAYTSGEHIVFAPGRFDPASTGGRGLIAHELAHVVQQRRGGARPALDAGAAHEHGAHAAAAAYSGGSGPVGVSGATGVGMARSADDWLRGSVDVSSWGYSDLVAERTELQQWMDRQIAGDENTLKIEEALGQINARIRKLEEGVRGPQKTAKKGGKRNQKKDDSQAAPAEPDPEMEPPRCLVAQATIVFQDRDEMRHEFDHIVAWLQRKSVSPAERKLLQDELQYLAPLLGETLQQQAQEKRRARIGAALRPTGGGAGRAAIVEAVRLVESIKPVSGHEDQYYLMSGEEMLTLSKDEVTRIRASAMAAMVDAIKQVKSIDDSSAAKLESQNRVDQENGFAAWGVSLFTDMDTSDAVDKFLPISAGTTNAMSAFYGAKRNGDLMGMAEQLANAEEMALRGQALVNGHLDDIQSTGAKVITGLQITQAAAFTIVMVATAGAAAPAVGAGVAGLGFTGTTATILTAGGTAGIVGTEGFLLGGGSSTAGQLAAGRSLSDSLDTGWEEGKKWGETGVKIGAGAVLAPAAAARFGASAPGIGLGSQMLRTGAAVGTTNLAVDEASSLAFHQKSLTWGEAGTSFGGGFLGGLGGPVIGKLDNPALKNIANVGWGATTSGGLNYLQTGDKDQAFQAAALGGASSLSLGHPQPSQKTLDTAFNAGRSVRSSANSFKRSAANTLGATMLGVKLSGAAPGITGSGFDPRILTTPTLGLHEPVIPPNRTNAPAEQNLAKPDQPAIAPAPADRPSAAANAQADVAPAQSGAAAKPQAELSSQGVRAAPGERSETRDQYRTRTSQERFEKRIDRTFQTLENGDQTGGVGVDRVTGGKSDPRTDGRRVPGPRELQSGQVANVHPDGTPEDPRERILDTQHIRRQPGETERQAVARVKTVVGHKISEFPALEALWESARKSVLSRNKLTSTNYENLYSKTRNAFWRRVRGKTPEAAAARAQLAAAGFELPKKSQRAAQLQVDGDVFEADRTLSLDHVEEKGQGQGWQKALDADNLRFEFSGANSEREIKQMRHPDLRGP